MSSKRFYLFLLFGSIYCSTTLPKDQVLTAKGFNSYEPVPRGPRLPLERFGNSLYYFGGIYTGSHQQSSILCAYFNMELVSIETKEENDFLESMIPQYFLWASEVYIWTSGELFGSGLIWKSTGKSIDYSNWKSGEPNSGSGSYPSIRLLYVNETKKLQWELQSNSASGYTICESSINETWQK